MSARLRAQERPESLPAEWQKLLTVEVVLYLLIGLVAVLVRLWRLDAWPLSPAEAAQAWGAWQIARGQVPAVTSYSPLLMTLNIVCFALFRASDAVARLWPALFGTALALLPLLLRRQLGRAGALAASLLLALSPSLVAVSRLLDGRTAALFAGLLLLAVLARLLEGGGRREIWLSAAALALGLLSAPMFYSLLLLFISGAVVLWAARRLLGMEGFWASAGRRFAELRGQRGWWREGSLLFLGLFLLLGTGFLLNVEGLGAAADLLPAWGRSFAWGPNSYGPLTVLWSMLLYETVGLLFGIAGLVMGLRRREPFSLFAGWWLVAGLILSLVMGRWQSADLALLAVPVALLAGKALGELADWTAREAVREAEWLILLVGTVLAVFGYLGFAQYARAGQLLSLLLAVAACPLILLLVAGVVLLWGERWRALRGLALLAAGGGLLLLVHNTWFATQLADVSRVDLFAALRAEPGVQDMAALAQRYGSQVRGDPYSAPILLVGDEVEWLRWALRDFRRVDYVQRFEGAGDHPIVITPANLQPPLGESFVGQDIVVYSDWRPAGMQGWTLARWLISRVPPAPPSKSAIIFWAQR
ncbi:MAG: hypothetical protein ACUVT1_04670 [Anaerolineae bacterium]